MNRKRIASILLVLALALTSVGAFATSGEDYEAKIKEYEAKIAELEQQVADLTAQLDLQNYVATFDGGHVTVADAMDRYEYVSYMYESYGYSISGYEDDVKQDIMTSMVQDAIVQYEAAQKGLAEPDETQVAELQAAAQASLDEYIDYYRTNFEAEGKSEEDVVTETTAYLSDNGITLDMFYQQQLESFAQKELFADLVKDVTVTDDDVKAEYDKLVAADQASYESADGYTYESAATGGTAIYWNPEGYRTVKHVLIAFSDDQATRYSDITGRISALETELSALTATPAPETTAEATAEATVEPTATPRTADEINADLTAANEELDALYEELTPAATEVVDQFNAGTDIDTLISTYGGDPGMAAEPGLSKGYVVSANSTYWEDAFTQAAMAIPAIGQISEPVRGSNGIHIIYYLGDVTPGAVDYETAKEAVSATLLDTKQNETYDAQIQTWMTELNVQYYLDNFR